MTARQLKWLPQSKRKNGNETYYLPVRNVSSRFLSRHLVTNIDGLKSCTRIDTGTHHSDVGIPHTDVGAHIRVGSRCQIRINLPSTVDTVLGVGLQSNQIQLNTSILYGVVCPYPIHNTIIG